MEYKAEQFLYIELENDKTPFGGISFIGETLQDFLDGFNWSYDSSMELVNAALIDNGIKPIAYDGYSPNFYTREEVFEELQSRHDIDENWNWEFCYEYVIGWGKTRPLSYIVDEWVSIPNKK